jgi:hypothetical protein
MSEQFINEDDLKGATEDQRYAVRKLSGVQWVGVWDRDTGRKMIIPVREVIRVSWLDDGSPVEAVTRTGQTYYL